MDQAPLAPLPRAKDDDHGPQALLARRELAERAAGLPLAHLAGLPVDRAARAATSKT